MALKIPAVIIKQAHAQWHSTWLYPEQFVVLLHRSSVIGCRKGMKDAIRISFIRGETNNYMVIKEGVRRSVVKYSSSRMVRVHSLYPLNIPLQ
jgi:hypothetical protein